MKKIQILLLIFLCFLITACGPKYTENVIILKAESLMNEHPDSAYHLLSKMVTPEQLSNADYAAWCLQYTHAQYKLYKDINSDSIINVAVNYYADSKLAKYSGTSFYLLGCVSELLHRKEKAMFAYKKATEVLEGTNEYDILGLTTINMGYVYEQAEKYYQANRCIRRSIDYFKLSGNKNYQASSYLALSNMCLQLDYPFDSTLYYSNKALKLAKESDDLGLYYTIISRQGEFLYKKNSSTAINNLRLGYVYCPNLENRNAAYLAYIYSTLNMTDSVSFYLKIANKEEGDSESEIIKNLADAGVYESQNDFKNAYYSIESAYLNQDTVFRKKLKNQSYKIDKQFDLSEKERENAELEIENQEKVIWIGLLIIFVLVVFIILFLVINHNKKIQTQSELQQQKSEFELKENAFENKKKKELLLSNLRQRIEMTVRFNKLQQGFCEPQKQAEFIDTLTNQVILAKTEWENYINEANNMFDNKIAYLKETNRELTPADLIVIVLISVDIDISDSCVLLDMSKETMYIRRKRVKKRLGIDIDLEVWIKNYLC